MSIEVRPVRNKKDREVFVRIPYPLYKFDHNWTAPLLVEQRDLMTPGKNPWFEHGEAEFFVAYNDGEPVGRISAQIDKLHLDIHGNDGFFGFFECPNDTRVSKALFEAAEDWLKNKGVERVVGPFTLSINEYCGFLVDGWEHPPMIMMTHNPSYYNDLVVKSGYKKVKDLYAWHYDILKPIPKMAVPVAEAVAKHPGLKIRTFDMKNFDRDLRIVLDIFNDAWKNNWFYVPMTDAEVEKAAKDFKLIIEPRAVLIAEVDGDPAGMCLCFPNINEGIYGLDGKLFPTGIFRLLWRLKVRRLRSMRLLLLGVRKKYRGSTLGGLSILLYTEIHRRTRELGYEFGELGWTLEDNKKINQGIEFMGGKVYKTYRMYDKPLAES